MRYICTFSCQYWANLYINLNLFIFKIQFTQSWMTPYVRSAYEISLLLLNTQDCPYLFIYFILNLESQGEVLKLQGCLTIHFMFICVRKINISDLGTKTKGWPSQVIISSVTRGCVPTIFSADPSQKCLGDLGLGDFEFDF